MTNKMKYMSWGFAALLGPDSFRVSVYYHSFMDQTESDSWPKNVLDVPVCYKSLALLND